MTAIDIQLDGDNCWPELTRLRADGLLDTGELVGVALLPDGEVTDGFTGQIKRVPTVTLRIRVERPTACMNVLVQLKVETLEMLARAMRGRLEYLASLKARGGRDS